MLNELFNNILRLKDDFMNYVKVETDYVKLTIAEKVVKIATIIVLGALCVVTMWFIALLMSFALAQFLSLFLPAWAAYLCTAGAFLLFLLFVYLLRRPLIMNPLSKAITQALFKKKDADDPDLSE